jgi:hypothetical protein
MLSREAFGKIAIEENEIENELKEEKKPEKNSSRG